MAKSSTLFKKGHKRLRSKESYLNQKNSVKSIKRKCKSCGKLFLWKPYKKKSKGIFCSRKCIDFKKEKNPNWKGGKLSPYCYLKYKNIKKWIEWRNFIFKRDNFMCLVCGRRGIKLDPHHIQKVRLYPNLIYQKSNGITVCKKCHKLIENKKKTETFDEILERILNNLWLKLEEIEKKIK